MPDDKDLNDMCNDLLKISNGISRLNNAMSGKIIVEKNKIVDTSLPINKDKLSPDSVAAMKEYDYIEGRKKNIMSAEHLDRIARDYLDSNSEGVLKVDVDFGEVS